MTTYQKLMKTPFSPNHLITSINFNYLSTSNKSIDLLNLSENSDIPYLVQQINEKEPLTIKYKSKIQKVIESN